MADAWCSNCGRPADAVCTVEGCEAQTCRRCRNRAGVCVGEHIAAPAALPVETTPTVVAEEPEEPAAEETTRPRRRRKSGG